MVQRMRIHVRYIAGLASIVIEIDVFFQDVAPTVRDRPHYVRAIQFIVPGITGLQYLRWPLRPVCPVRLVDPGGFPMIRSPCPLPG